MQSNNNRNPLPLGMGSIKKLRDRQFKVVRVSKTEFELDTGDVFPFPSDMEEELTVEEFQTILDNSKKLVLKILGGIEDD